MWHRTARWSRHPCHTLGSLCRQLAEQTVRRGEVLFDVEVLRIDHRLHRASFNEANGHRRKSFRGNASKTLRLRPQDFAGDRTKCFAVTVQLGLHSCSYECVREPLRPKVEKEPDEARLARQAIHVSPQQREQPVQWNWNACDVLGYVEDRSGLEHVVEQGDDQLIFCLEMKEDKSGAQLRAMRDQP